jgi:hypothetical protein
MLNFKLLGWFKDERFYLKRISHSEARHFSTYFRKNFDS